MRYCLCSLLLLMVLFSCTEEVLPGLHPNAINSVDPFELLRTDIVQRSETRGDATLHFTSVYSQLNEAQRERISGIEVIGYSGFIGRFELDAEAASFTLPNLRIGQRYCCTLRFITREQESPEAEFCITP